MGSLGFVKSIQQGQDKTFSGNVTSYNVKWSKDIEGWDFDPKDAYPSLLMEYDCIVGNYLPAGVVAALSTAQYRNLIAAMGEDGSMVANTGSEQTMNGTTAMIGASNQALRSNRLTFGGERTRIATFEWASNCTVDGSNEQSHAQIMAVWPVSAMNYRGNAFVGFVALAGISYPGGQSIIQDPSVSADAYTDLSTPTVPSPSGETTTSHGFLGLIMIAAVCMAAAVVVVLVMRGKKGKSGPRYVRP